MDDVILNVRIPIDPSGIQKFANETRNLLRQIEAQARGAGGPTLSQPQVQTKVQAAQAQAEASLTAIRGSGVLTPAQMTGLETGVRRDFQRVAEALQVQLAGAEQVKAAAGRANEASRTASTAQQRADQLREQRAAREAAQVGRAATGAAAPPADEARLARLTQSQLLSRQAGRAARLIEAELDPSLASDKAAAEAALETKKFADAQARRARQAQRAAEVEANLDAADRQTRAETLIATAKGRGAVAREVIATPGGVETVGRAQADTAGLRARTQAVEARTILASEQELEARVAATRDRRRLADAVRVELGLQTQAQRAAAAKVREDERAAAAKAREAAQAERAAKQAAAAAAPGTGFQRFQQVLAGRTGQEQRPAVSFPTLGQAVGSGLVTTARFALSGAALYGIANTVQQLVRDSSVLERIFNQIQAQFTAVGQGNEFAGFRRAIFDISKETGETAKDVAFVGFQMKGAFGDTATAVNATADAIKIARVTGLALNEVVDSLTGASLSFGVSVARVGDEALGVQERFGVLAQESIKVFGDTGIVARQAGLDIHELGALIGGLQQISAKSGSSIAENINRVLPAIHESAGAILDLYQRVPQLANRFPVIGDLVSKGQSGQVLIELVRDFERLDKTTQDYVITQLGSRKEAQTVIGILRQHGVIVGYLDAQYNNVGKTQRYFDDLQKTLAQRVARLRAEFVAFGQDLFSSGIGTALKDVATAATGVIQIAGGVVHVFATVNQATGGLATKLLELYAVLRLIAALRAVNLGEGILGALLGGTRAAAGASAVSAAVGARTAALGGFLGSIPARYAAGYASGSAAGAGALGGLLGSGGAAAGGVVGGSLEALGLTSPWVLAAAGALVVNAAYQSQKGKVQKAAKTFADQLNGVTDDRLKQLIEDQSKGLEGVEQSVLEHLGFSTPRRELTHEQGRRQFGKIGLEAQALREAGLATGRDSPDLSVLGVGLDFFGSASQSVATMYDRAAKGYGDEIAAIQEQIAAARKDPKKRAKLEAKVAELKAKTAAADSASAGAIGVADDAQDAKALYDAGLLSGAEYIDKLDKAISDLAAQIPSLPADQRAQAQRSLDNMRRDVVRTQSDFLKSAAEFNIAQRELAGGEPQQKIDSLLGLLRNPDFTDPKARVQVSNDIVAAQKEILNQQVQAAATAAEAADILRTGIPVPPEVRVQQTVDAVRAFDTNFNAYLAKALGGVQAASDATVAIVNLAITGNISLAQAARAILQRQLDSLQGVLAMGTEGTETESTLQQIKRVRDALDAGTPDSVVAPAAARITGSPGEIAAKTNQAARDAEAAAKKAHQEQEAAARARIALRKALTEGDPVAQAQAAIEEAQYLASIAETEAESINAQAQLVTAQHQLALAQVQVGDAYRNIDRALAEAAGDTVRVAQIELEQARAHVQAARDRGDLLGGLEAQAQQVSAQANLVQAQIDAGEKQTDFLLQMERITTGQAIAQLEALLRIPGITQEQTNALLLKIHQLRKDVSKDVQFDIPSDIKLPTLYEVRRANQMASVGAGYQDNRNISIAVTANNAGELQQIATTFADAFSGPPRYGTLPRKY